MTIHTSGSLFAPLAHGAAGLNFFQPSAAAFDFGEDIFCSRLPDERLGIAIPRRDKFLDSGHPVGNAGEAAAPDRFAGQIAKPTFDHIEPTGTGRNKMHVKAPTPCQPASNLRSFVSAVVVQDQMQVEILRILGIDLTQEAQKLLVPMVRETTTRDRSGRHVEGGKECGGAMAHIIVRPRATASALHRQSRLRAIQGESRPRESHPKSLAEPDGTLPRHPAPIVRTVTLPKASQWMNNRGCRLTIFFSQRWLRRGCCASLRYFRRAQLRSL